MRELSMQEIDCVSGGNGVVTFLINVGAGAFGNYVYNNPGAVMGAAFPPYGLYRAASGLF